jgi:hypothetical protein
MSTNGRRRPGTPPRLPVSRPVRVLIGVVVAAVIAIALVTPIVLVGGSSQSAACAKTLRFDNVTYTARAAPTPRPVESLAIGSGVLSGCDTPPSNIDVRSLSGVQATVAVGIPTDATSVYVRRSLCSGLAAQALSACLRSH